MVGKSAIYQHLVHCSSKFDIQHSMSFKKGAFVSIRHNELRDLTANIRSIQGYRN